MDPQVAQPAATSADARRVVFLAGGERFALPLEAVREVVVPRPPFARVPRAHDAVRGAMNLRGRVLAVVELAPLLGLPPDPRADRQGHVIVLDGQRRGLGLLVASVVGVDPLDPGADEAPDAPATVLDPDALEARAAALFQRAS